MAVTNVRTYQLQLQGCTNHNCMGITDSKGNSAPIVNVRDYKSDRATLMGQQSHSLNIKTKMTCVMFYVSDGQTS